MSKGRSLTSACSMSVSKATASTSAPQRPVLQFDRGVTMMRAEAASTPVEPGEDQGDRRRCTSRTASRSALLLNRPKVTRLLVGNSTIELPAWMDFSGGTGAGQRGPDPQTAAAEL